MSKVKGDVFRILQTFRCLSHQFQSSEVDIVSDVYVAHAANTAAEASAVSNLIFAYW